MRHQLALAWQISRWVIWPVDLPLWGQLVYKIGQAVTIIGILEQTLWIWSAGILLSFVCAIVAYRGSPE